MMTIGINLSYDEPGRFWFVESCATVPGLIGITSPTWQGVVHECREWIRNFAEERGFDPAEIGFPGYQVTSGLN